MSFISACCNTAPVASGYTPRGSMESRDGLDYYIVGGETGAQGGVVFCYDIFGLHANALQVADLLSAAGGLCVVVPDFLEGRPLREQDLGDASAFREFRDTRGTWAYNRRAFAAAVDVLRARGAQRIATAGFCWGAKLSISALAEQEQLGVASAALVHPSLLVREDFEKAQGPVLLLFSKDEEDLSEGFALLKARACGSASFTERYQTMSHGFCAARGDFADAEVAKHVSRVVQLSADFFRRTLA
ncbi:hypothetical protein GGI07_005356 [Coemansia sp. Benny D115]|nr:hypothetical protein GGI07_005356 [Coemansia sp. Benny D115]